MSKNLEKKKQIVDDVTKTLQDTGNTKGKTSTVIFNYSTVSSNEMNTLRATLFEVGANLRIVKNTLIKRAFDTLKISLDDTLEGQNAVLTHEGDDFITPLKTLFRFIKENEKGEVVLGVLNSNLLNKQQVEALSKIPSRDELLGQLVGSLSSPIRGFAYTLNGVQSNFVRALSAVRDQKSE